MINKCCDSRSVLGVSCMGAPVVQGAKLVVCNEPILKSCGGTSIMPGDKVVSCSDNILKSCDGTPLAVGATVMTCADDNYLTSVTQQSSSTSVTLTMRDGTTFVIDIASAIENYFKDKPVCV